MNILVARQTASLAGVSSQVAVLALCLWTMPLPAQMVVGVTDAMTPPAVAPGAPAGSYALSGFETVNLFNGNLSFHLPLLRVGGRGEAAYTMTLTSMERRWQIQEQLDANGGHTGSYFAVSNLLPGSHWWSDTAPPEYSPGLLVARRAASTPQICPGYHSPTAFQTALTRLTFIGGDGTELDLVDQNTGGAALPVPDYCGGAGASRGRVFVARDGSAATFLADANIIDRPYFDDLNISYPSGYLLLRDGLRYRIDAGLVSWIADRNGNRISFVYDAGALTQVIDSLGRPITITHGEAFDQITFLGAGGTQRTIQVHFAPLQAPGRLAPGQTIQSYNDLLGAYGGSSSPFNPKVVSSVVLPDGRAYEFRYNSYAELASAKLPTGGEYRYVWGGGDQGFSVLYNAGRPYVYRRVTHRDVYPDGATLEGRTCYGASYGMTTVGGVSYPFTLVTVDRQNAAGVSIAQEKRYFYGNSREPDQEQGNDIPYINWKQGKEYQADEAGPGGAPLLRQTVHAWAQRGCEPDEQCLSSDPRNAGAISSTDPRILSTTTTLKSTAVPPQSSQVASVSYTYDRYNNRTNVYESDYGTDAPGSLLRRRYFEYLTGSYATDLAVHLRSLLRRQKVYNAADQQEADTEYLYDQSTPQGPDPATGYSAPTTSLRGNVTTVKRWSSASVSASETRAYDVAGNVISVADPRGYPTTYSYADDSACPPAPGYANTRAFPTAITNALNHTARLCWDYKLGRLASFTDPNGAVTSYNYNDLLDRLKLVTHPTGAGTTGYDYFDTQRTVTATRSQNSCSQTNAIVSSMVYDGLGRQVQTVLQAGGKPSVLSSRSYDALGRLYEASFPYLSGATPCSTRYSYDALGRVIEERTTCDSAATTWNYEGRAVTVTDPAGKQRRLVSDALGRLTQVETPSGPAYQTAYGYDVLDNLVSVNQGGQTRAFVFDWLGQLTSAQNPESGTTSYTYDASGNLQSRTDARGVVTSYVNDPLNRVSSKTYGDGTPTVTYSYDTCSKGRLCQVTNAAATVSYSYDPAGRVSGSSQLTDGQPYTFSYTYNLAGGLETVTYPSKTAAPSSGRAVRTCYDAAGRPNGVSNVATSAAYATVAEHAAHGAPTQMTLGNGVAESSGFNGRLQPVSITAARGVTLLGLTLNYGGSNNNGNVLSQNITAGGLSFAQSYTYDAVNRLKTASEAGGWPQVYVYDRWGNRALLTGAQYYIPGGTLTPQVAADQEPLVEAQFPGNRWVGVTYDNGQPGPGNVTQLGSWTLAYDAEGRLKTSTFNSVTTTYSYDGEGRRVKKVGPAGTTVYVYDAAGQLGAEYGSGEESGTHYLTADHLGSVRLVTDAGGNVKSRHDYLPFGEEIPAGLFGRTGQWGAPDNLPQRFTGKERDTESGLDYFGARYFSGAQGRFTSADAPLADQDLADPQSWSLYNYARNNPLRYIDPSGRSCLNSVGQVVEDGPTGSGPVGDNGDGKGCAAVGVRPSTEEERRLGEDIMTRQAVDVHAEPQLDPLVAIALRSAALTAEPGVNLAAAGTALVIGGAFTGMAYGAIGGGELMSLGRIVPELVRPSPGQVAAVSRTAAQGGRKAVEKFLQGQLRALAEHEAKLAQYRQASGYTSAVEKTIRNARRLIAAAEEWLRNNP